MDKLEKKILEIIDANAEKLIAFGSDIWEHPELGYMEHRTASKFAEQLKELGLDPQEGIAVTGVKAYLKEKMEGEFRLCLMGELDALAVPGHPRSDPKTGACHACGHNAQLTGVLGAAIALSDPEVREALGGNIVFIGVPDEEAGTPLEIIKQMLEDGTIHYDGGKCEMILSGALDDIDMTLGHHTTSDAIKHQVSNAPSMGMIRKQVTFFGRSSHPSRAGHAIDTQKAAVLTVNNINAQRESMDLIWHPNRAMLHTQIMSAANAVNVISDKTTMSFDIRSQEQYIIDEQSYLVDRAVEGAAIVSGAGYELSAEPGYLPIIPVKDATFLSDCFKDIDPEGEVEYLGPDNFSGTTDYGDLSNVMPLLQFQTGGQKGAIHGVDYEVTDPYEHYILTAKMFALAAYRLMKDDAALAKQIRADNPPRMTTEEWRQMKEAMKTVKTREITPIPSFGPKTEK